MIKIAVLGYGTVGSGVVEVLETNRESITKRAGDVIDVKYVLDLRDFPGNPVQEKIVHDYDVILKDEEIKIVVEVMGGVEPAFTFVKQALMAGKNVATSNKELVAKHGAKLIAIAREHSVNFMFEASVGGGIPIIRPLIQSLTADEIVEITGILNGTTNYMLTKMSEDGLDYEDVLKNAQEKGYAERNPAADVEGYDACRKIAILSSLMTGKTVRYEDIYTEGITKITKEDFLYAKKMNKFIKLLASAKALDGGYAAIVAPFMVGEKNPLHSVNDVFNAIFIRGNTLGDSMYYGRGAGKLPTASAVVSDVIDCAKHGRKHIICIWEEEKLSLKSVDDASRKFFVRVSEGAEAEVAKLFGDVEKIEAEGVSGEFGFVTPVMTEKEFAGKIAELPGFISRIRMEED